MFPRLAAGRGTNAFARVDLRYANGFAIRWLATAPTPPPDKPAPAKPSPQTNAQAVWMDGFSPLVFRLSPLGIRT